MTCPIPQSKPLVQSQNNNEVIATPIPKVIKKKIKKTWECSFPVTGSNTILPGPKIKRPLSNEILQYPHVIKQHRSQFCSLKCEHIYIQERLEGYTLKCKLWLSQGGDYG